MVVRTLLLSLLLFSCGNKDQNGNIENRVTKKEVIIIEGTVE